MPHLKFRDPDGRSMTVDLEGRNEVTIGRQPGCEVVFSKRFVSRKHARIFSRDGRWHVTDLDSSHGTFVNRVRVREKPLEGGDQILVGDELLLFADGTGREAPGEVATRLPADAVEITAKVRDSAPDKEMILTEADIESGDLMRAILAARIADVQEITNSPVRSVAQLARIQPLPPMIRDALARPHVGPPPPPPPHGGESRTDAEVAGHLLALVKISDELRRCTDLDSVCRTTVEMAMRATGATRGVLALRQGDSDEFVPKVQLNGLATRRGGAADEIRISRTFVRKVVEQKVALIARNTDLDVALAGRESIVAAGIRSILCAPMWDGGQIVGYVYLDITGNGRQFRTADQDLVSAIGHHAAAEIARLKLVDRIRAEENRRKELARFLSVDVIRHIEQEAKDGKINRTLAAKEQEVTVMFADIAGFTSISERMSPADVKRFLDDYLDYMTEVIVDKHGGTLDKYIGDAIMALFGAPFSQGLSVDATRAVNAAVAMRDTVEVLRKTRLDYADVRIRIGINTGKVIAGMIGSLRRLEYTVIGDTVNVASRLESSGEPGRILIGDATHLAVEKDFDCEYAGERQLRNREQPVKCWWVTAQKL